MSGAIEASGEDWQFGCVGASAAIWDQTRAKLVIDLADMDLIEKRIGAFEAVILRHGLTEHEFSPGEVLEALYDQREKMARRCDGRGNGGGR